MNSPIRHRDKALHPAALLRDPQPLEEYLHYAATRDFHWNVPAEESRRLQARFLEQFKK